MARVVDVVGAATGHVLTAAARLDLGAAGESDHAGDLGSDAGIDAIAAGLFERHAAVRRLDLDRLLVEDHADVHREPAVFEARGGGVVVERQHGDGGAAIQA